MRDNERRLSGALDKAPAIKTVFPADNDLAKQLKMVAKLISVRNELGLRRQIFFSPFWPRNRPQPPRRPAWTGRRRSLRWWKH